MLGMTGISSCMNSRFNEICDLSVTPGTVALLWCNSYSGIIIKSPLGVLLIDPVCIEPDEYIKADAIVVTHEHLDHFEPELVEELQRRTNAIVLATPFVTQRLETERASTLTKGKTLVIRDFTLYVQYSDHPARSPISLLVSAQDGPTIYHPSDSRPFPQMAQLRERFHPEVLLYFGTSFGDAAEIAKLIDPQIVVSYFSDIATQKGFTDAILTENPKVSIKLLKRFEILRYPT